jgi:hypothetical protein
MAHEPHQRTLPELIRTVKALNSKLAQSKEKSDQFEITLGLTLAEAKERKPKDITWPDFVKKHFSFGQSRSDELIRIGKGTTTVETQRAGKAARTAKSKAKAKVSASGTDSPPLTTDAPKEDQARQVADAGSFTFANVVEASKLARVKAKADRAAQTSAAVTARKVPEALALAATQIFGESVVNHQVCAVGVIRYRDGNGVSRDTGFFRVLDERRRSFVLSNHDSELEYQD